MTIKKDFEQLNKKDLKEIVKLCSQAVKLLLP